MCVYSVCMVFVSYIMLSFQKGKVAWGRYNFDYLFYLVWFGGITKNIMNTSGVSSTDWIVDTVIISIGNPY